MTLHQIVTTWLRWRYGKRMAREASALEHRRVVLIAQISARKEERKEWKPLLGRLRDATTAALRAEMGGR